MLRTILRAEPSRIEQAIGGVHDHAHSSSDNRRAAVFNRVVHCPDELDLCPVVVPDARALFPVTYSWRIALCHWDCHCAAGWRATILAPPFAVRHRFRAPGDICLGRALATSEIARRSEGSDFGWVTLVSLPTILDELRSRKRPSRMFARALCRIRIVMTRSTICRPLRPHRPSRLRPWLIRQSPALRSFRPWPRRR